MAEAMEMDDVDWTEVRKPNPHFFKVLIGDFTDRMKIPSNFMKNLQEDMTTKASSSSKPPALTATIEGPTGRTWYAELEKKTAGLFFTTGWSNFVRDHSLKENELLIFRYNGYLSFTVLIFDKTACEKDYPDDVSGNEGRNARLKPRKLSFGEDELGDQLKAKEKSFPSTKPQFNKSETEDEETNSVETSTRKRKKALERSKSKRGYKRLSRRYPVTEKEKFEVEAAAQSFASENPYFVIHLKSSHVYCRTVALRFPAEFSRKHLPRFRTEAILRVSGSSKTWPVAFIPYASDADRLSRGWLSFVRENSLEEDDYCAFELVKSVEFLVHIFRASKVMLPSASRARKDAKSQGPREGRSLKE